MKSRLAALLMAALYRIVNFALSACAWLLWPGPRPRDAHRVCVFRVGNVGDITCALPAIRAIRLAYPEAQLTVLTSPGARAMPSAADVLEGADWVDEIRVYYADEIDSFSKRVALLKELRAHRFDVWIDLPQDLSTISRQFRDMAFARLAGARWARGWRIDTLRWAAQAQTEHLRFRNEVERTVQIVRQGGFEIPGVAFGLSRQPQVIARIDRMLQARGLGSRKLVAIAPGAKRSTNLWVPERFAEVGRQLSDRGCAVVFLGERSDGEPCRRIAAAIGERAHSFAGELTVAESCEVLRRCELAICLDSGVQHLAAAVATPCVSLFSFWQMRGKWHPYGEKNVVVQKNVPCHTCLLEACPHENLCMKAIGVEDVLGAAFHILGTVSSHDERTHRTISLVAVSRG